MRAVYSFGHALLWLTVVLLSAVPLVCIASPSTVYTTNPGYLVQDSGLVNSVGQPASLSSGGHVRKETLPYPTPEDALFLGVNFSVHDNTVCDAAAGAMPHRSAHRFTVNSGAGTFNDGITIGVWYNERIYYSADVAQSNAGSAFYAQFDVDGVTHDACFDSFPNSIEFDFEDEVRYAVGAWQGDVGSYQTIAVTPAL